MTTPEDIGKRSEVIARNEREHDRIWNTAIEAAASEAHKIIDSFTDPSHCPYHLTLALNKIKELKK